MNGEKARFVKFRAGAATAELHNSEFYNMQHQEHEKQRLIQCGRKLQSHHGEVFPCVRPHELNYGSVCH